MIERNVGPDLSTLISLNDSQAGANTITAELSSLNVEQRKAWSDLQNVQKQYEILSDVSGSPESILEVPQELLALQPTLASLAKGLNDAILKHSRSKGRYEVSHPRVREDVREVDDIKERIKNKLARTIGSLNYQLELRQGKYDRITSLIEKRRQRLAELSSMRVDYETLKATASKKREIHGNSQASLAEIESLGAAAQKVDLISRIGLPQTELYADGPSSKIIVLAGMAAGLFIGLGLVMFVAPFDDPFGIDQGGSNTTEPSEKQSPTQTPKSKRRDKAPVEESTQPEQPAKPPEPVTANAGVSMSEPFTVDATQTEPKTNESKPVVASTIARSVTAIENTTSKSVNETVDSKTKDNADLLDSFFSSQKKDEPKGSFDSDSEDDKTEFSLKNTETELPLASASELEEVEISDAEIDRIIEQETSGLSESDLQKLRVGQNGAKNLPEKIHQVEQHENQAADNLNRSLESMNLTGGDYPSPATTELPLNTSIQNSAEPNGFGHESGDNQPENRPTATTVDLRMLKEQLSGKSQDQKSNKSLSDKLAAADTSDHQQVQNELDQSISDLANTIADVCKKTDD